MSLEKMGSKWYLPESLCIAKFFRTRIYTEVNHSTTYILENNKEIHQLFIIYIIYIMLKYEYYIYIYNNK